MTPGSPKRVYISGPMSGYPNFNFDAFFKAEREWREAGWDVYNPAALGPGGGNVATGDLDHEEWCVFIMEAIWVLLQGDITAIATLPNWVKSKGARIEVAVADVLRLPVYDAEDPEEL